MAALTVGMQAPDFELRALDGKRQDHVMPRVGTPRSGRSMSVMVMFVINN